MRQRQPNVPKADNRKKKVACQIIIARFLLTQVERFSLDIYFNIEIGYFSGIKTSKMFA